MSTKERAKACERALRNAETLCSRQRRNMKAYVKIILATRRALGKNDVVRALALVSANIKYPPNLIVGLDASSFCEHESRRQVWICYACGEEVTT